MAVNAEPMEFYEEPVAALYDEDAEVAEEAAVEVTPYVEESYTEATYYEEETGAYEDLYAEAEEAEAVYDNVAEEISWDEIAGDSPVIAEDTVPENEETFETTEATAACAPEEAGEESIQTEIAPETVAEYIPEDTVDDSAEYVPEDTSTDFEAETAGESIQEAQPESEEYIEYIPEEVYVPETYVETPVYQTYFLYEDDLRYITAELSEHDALPSTAQLIVRELYEDSWEEDDRNVWAFTDYEFQQYMEREHLTALQYRIYDIHFEVDGVWVVPSEKVKFTIIYKKDQLLDETISKDSVMVLHLDRDEIKDEIDAFALKSEADVNLIGSVTKVEFEVEHQDIYTYVLALTENTDAYEVRMAALEALTATVPEEIPVEQETYTEEETAAEPENVYEPEPEYEEPSVYYMEDPDTVSTDPEDFTAEDNADSLSAESEEEPTSERTIYYLYDSEEEIADGQDNHANEILTATETESEEQDTEAVGQESETFEQEMEDTVEEEKTTPVAIINFDELNTEDSEEGETPEVETSEEDIEEETAEETSAEENAEVDAEEETYKEETTEEEIAEEDTEKETTEVDIEEKTSKEKNTEEEIAEEDTEEETTEEETSEEETTEEEIAEEDIEEETTEEETSEEETTEEETTEEETTEEIRIRRNYGYIDDSVSVSVTLERPDAVPDHAQLSVTKVGEATDGYNYDAYLTALNEASDNNTVYTAGNTLFFDISFLVPEVDEEGNETGEFVEYEPEAGSVQVSIRFKQSQLAEELNAEDTANVEVTHLIADSQADISEITPDEIEAVTLDASVSLGNTEVVQFSTDSFSIYAISYTVDFSYSVDGEMYDFSLPGGEKIRLSELIEVLGVLGDIYSGEKPAFDSVGDFLKEVANVEFSDESLVQVTKNEEENDWELESLQPFDTEEILTITMKNGDVLLINVSDAQYTENLTDLFKSLEIYKNNDRQDLTQPIIVRDGDTFRLKIAFEEHDIYQFSNDPNAVMYFDMPAEFILPDDFTTTSDISISVGGKPYTLRDNPVTYNTETHRLELRWNTTDRYAVDADGNARKLAEGEQPAPGETLETNEAAFGYLKKSGDTQITIDVNGKFGSDINKTVTFANSVNLEIANPADARVAKTGTYDKETQTITNTVTVRADGNVMQKIDLTDTLGSALSYENLTTDWLKKHITITEPDPAIRDEAAINALIEAIADSLTAADGSYSLTIPEGSGSTPALYDGEVVEIIYNTHVDLTKVSVSGADSLTYETDEYGNPTAEKNGVVEDVFAEVGNTVEISNPGNRYDEPENNSDFWGPKVSFSDLTKTGTLSDVLNGQDSRGNDISYRDISWQVITNSDAKGTLAGSTITDTVQYLTKYVSELTLEPLSGPEAGIEVLVYKEDNLDTPFETRIIPWSKLHITRSTDTDENGDELKSITWTYDVPSTDENYKYVINYKNRALLDNIKGPSDVWNTASGRGGVDDARVPLAPPGNEGIGMTKNATASGLENIDWKMEIKARPQQYNRYFRITDTLPYMWIEQDDGSSRMYKDTYKDEDFEEKTFGNITVKSLKSDFIQVKGLQDNEAWTAELVRGESYVADKLIIRFYRQMGDGTWVEGLSDAAAWIAGDGSEYKTSLKDKDGNDVDRRLITIDLKTRNNYDPDNPDNWVDLSTEKALDKSWYMTHINRANVRGDDGDYAYDEDEQVIIKPKIIKKLHPDTNWEHEQYMEITENGQEYPAYRFQTSVGGVSDTYLTEESGERYIVIRDTFDTSKWEVYDPSNSNKPRAFAGPNAGWPNTITGGFTEFTNAGDLTYASFIETADGKTISGVDFKIKISDETKQADGSFYPFYTLLYYLVPKQDAAGSREAAMNAIVQEALDPNNKVERAHEVTGIANYTNNAAFSTVGSMMANYEYEYNPAGKKISSIKGNVVTYELTLNAARAQLLSEEEKAAGKKLEMTDEHSANMSIDYSSIKIYINDETEPDSLNRVTYDYSGYKGTFQIPDETKVRIVYDATLVAAAGTELDFWNKATMDGYSTTVEDKKEIESSSTSSAGVYQIRLHKYATGNLGGGLTGAKFRLLDADKNPILIQNPDYRGPLKGEDGEIVFTTPAGTNGYVTVELDESALGVHFKRNTVYYLQEIVTPTEQVGDKTVFYKQDATLYSFLFNDNPDYAAPDGIYRYSNGDEMKVRNYVDRGGINISKLFSGNVELTDEQKNHIEFQIQVKLEEGDTAPEGAQVVEENGEKWTVVKTVKYSEFKWVDWGGDSDQGHFDSIISGNYHYELKLEDIGKTYRVVETVYEYKDITGTDNPKIASSKTYMIDGKTVSDTAAKKIDAENISDKSHTYVVTNSYFEKKYTIIKVDEDSGAKLQGAKFSVYKYPRAEQDSSVKVYTTDENGLLEIRRVDGGYESNTLYYAEETEAPAGYALPKTAEKFYFYFSEEGKTMTIPSELAGEKVVDLSTGYGSARVSNGKGTVSVPAKKTWGLSGNQQWPGTVQYVKVGLYQQEEGSEKTPVPVLKDKEPYVLILNAEQPEALFTDLPGASDSGKKLIYTIQELAISYDGKTDGDPTDSYTVTYRTEEGEDGAPDILVVNNTDKGTSIEVTKQWYEKKDDGTTVQINNPTGSEYQRTFHLYRTTEKKDAAMLHPVTISKADSASNYTLLGDSVFEPGDQLKITVSADQGENINAAFRYNGYNEFSPTAGGWQQSGTEKTYYAVLPENTDSLHLYDWSTVKVRDENGDEVTMPAKPHATVTIERVVSGSTVKANVGKESNETAVSNLEEVAEFLLPSNGSWTYTNDDLDKYDLDGQEYYYWVKEDGADGNTTYAYKNGQVTVNNYKETTSMRVEKNWDSETHPNSLLFDLYRTTDEIEGSEQIKEGQYKVRLLYDWEGDLAKEGSGPEYLVVAPGDRIQLKATEIDPLPDEIYKARNNGDYENDWAYQQHIQHGKDYYSANIALHKNHPWKEGSKITSFGKWWMDNNEITFEYTVQEADLKDVSVWYIRVYEFPLKVTLTNLNATGDVMTHDQLSAYAPGGTHGGHTELVSTITMTGTSWDSSDMILPKYDENGNAYHYFAVERLMPGYEATYEVKDGQTIISNKEIETEKGKLNVTKTMSGLPDDLARDKKFYFTLSQNGYYFKADGSFGTDPMADGFTHELSWNSKTRSYSTVTFSNLPVGEYTVEEIMSGTKSAQVPQYQLTSKIKVDGAEVTDGTVTVVKDKSKSVIIENTYEKGVEQTSISAVKVWKDKDGITLASTAVPDGASVQLRLRRFLADGQEDEFGWDAAANTVILDGKPDGEGSGELSAWIYTWNNLDKVYWDYDSNYYDGEYKEYRYEVEELSVTFNGVTTNLTAAQNNWDVTALQNKNGSWTITNKPNTRDITISKQWVNASNSPVDWPYQDGEWQVIEVEVSKYLQTVSGRFDSADKAILELVPDTAQLAALNASTGLSVSFEKNDSAKLYIFKISGLSDTGSRTTSAGAEPGIWHYRFTERIMDAYDTAYGIISGTSLTQGSQSYAEEDGAIINRQGTVPFTFHKVWYPLGTSTEKLSWQKDISVELYQDEVMLAEYTIGIHDGILTATSQDANAPAITVDSQEGYDYTFTIQGLARGKICHVIEC